MKVQIKGGVWKNTEDEILKAAVMKYGKNQWARISSLLVRKTAHQCKARWFEWLDPSIKKTEWSREEDEKLLHLAKLMPTQWRTIAPIVGRTPAQCLDRYHQLLFDAEKGSDELALGAGPQETGPTADDIRRLRPGEIDPDPETKPARPDPIDMDEDEKEMLSEARARLANTQGKKAKRKAREKQLEEARRMALHQKRRELKAAGIEVQEKKKNRGMDYNADIPFERKVIGGVYDTSEELNKKISDPNFSQLKLQDIEPKKRHELAEEQQKLNAKKQKANKNLSASAQLAELANQEFTVNRKKLVLPTPQVGDAELEEIVKLSRDNEEVRFLTQGEDGSTITQGLLNDYSKPSSSFTPLRTPRTPALVDNVRLEAQNLLALTNAQTPLLGEDNGALNYLTQGTGFDGATPRRSVTQTPNPMLAQLDKDGYMRPDATPGAFSQASFQTPARNLRDNFGINTSTGISTVASTPADEKFYASQLKQQLTNGFANLPAPKNDFVIVVPEEEEEEVEEEDAELSIQDAAELEQQKQEDLEEEERLLLQQRSVVLKLGLPRPVNVPSASYLDTTLEESLYDKKTQSELFFADRLVQEEMIRLLQYESVVYPDPRVKKVPKFDLSNYEIYTPEQLAAARDLVEEEVQKSLAAGITVELPELQSSLFSVEDCKVEFDALKAELLKLGTTAKKNEKKLGVRLGGYMAKAKQLIKNVKDLSEKVQEANIELKSVQQLHHQESINGPLRLEKLQAEVDKLQKHERQSQERYAELNHRKLALIKELYPNNGANVVHH